MKIYCIYGRKRSGKMFLPIIVDAVKQTRSLELADRYPSEALAESTAETLGEFDKSMEFEVREITVRVGSI